MSQEGASAEQPVADGGSLLAAGVDTGDACCEPRRGISRVRVTTGNPTERTTIAWPNPGHAPRCLSIGSPQPVRVPAEDWCVEQDQGDLHEVLGLEREAAIGTGVIVHRSRPT